MSVEAHRYVGRDFSCEEIAYIRALCSDPATPTREAIARAACEALCWRAQNGALKTMSAKQAVPEPLRECMTMQCPHCEIPAGRLNGWPRRSRGVTNK